MHRFLPVVAVAATVAAANSIDWSPQSYPAAPASYSNSSSTPVPVPVPAQSPYSNLTSTTILSTTRIVIYEPVSSVATSDYSTFEITETAWPGTSEISPAITEPVSPVLPQSSGLLASESQYTLAPVATEQLTKTEVVYQTVDVTVTACSPSGTDACAAPHLPELPLPGPPATCVLPASPLTNEQQVGNSLWGSLCQPTFPPWLPDEYGVPYASAPWEQRTTKSHDAVVDSDIPVTNVTRKYDWTITRGTISADGVVRDVMLVNNQFPGPAVEANWGDMIEVTVHNNISYPLEGTSIHWHGFLQRGSNWADGVPSVSQCPIAPYHSYTYRFPAQLYGSSWYHAHYSAQYTAGIAGPIIVYGPSQVSYDVDLGPVMLSDWYHIPYFSIVSDAVGTDLSEIPPVSDSLLINGRGRFNCSSPSYGNQTEFLASYVSANLTWTCVDGAELSKFRFQPGKTHRLRLMNMGADGVQKFTIDGHELTVIAYDYVPTVPHTTEVVTLGVGQRADVLVTANNYTSNMYWMRSSAPGGPTCGGSNMPEVLAAIYYEGADTSDVPSTIRSVNDTSCDNLPLDTTHPEYSITPSENPYHLDMAITLVLNSTGNYEWRLNNQTFRANFNEPSLFLAAGGNTSYPYDPQWNVYDMGSNHSVVVNLTNLTPFNHPFHLHGHNFYVLNVGGNGSTPWDGTTINPSNPMRRDIQIVPALGWAAIMFESDNAGVWPFHCHVAWHLSGGLAVNFMTHPESIPTIPDGEYDQTCADWNYYSNNNVVDQIDAGS